MTYWWTLLLVVLTLWLSIGLKERSASCDVYIIIEVYGPAVGIGVLLDIPVVDLGCSILGWTCLRC